VSIGEIEDCPLWLGPAELLASITGLESGPGLEKASDLEWEGREWVKEGAQGSHSELRTRRVGSVESSRRQVGAHAGGEKYGEARRSLEER
jgi:hypothetical protein